MAFSDFLHMQTVQHSAAEMKNLLILKHVYTSSFRAEVRCTLHAAKLAVVPVCSLLNLRLLIWTLKENNKMHVLGDTWSKVTLKLFS